MVVALGLPALDRITYQKVNSTTRKLVGLVRTIRNDAILLNNIYRLAIDFEKKEYWVESQREFKMLDPLAEAPKKTKKGAEPPPSNFDFATKYSSKPIPMPSGVVFDGVLKEREGLKKEGIVYIHFFPNGFNEQAILYVNKEGAKNVAYSMILRPTLGRVEIFPKLVTDFNIRE